MTARLVQEELHLNSETWHLDRLIVPFRPEVRAGFLKDDLWIRIASRKSEAGLWISLRPQKLAFSLIRGKGPAAHASAPKSPFDQFTSKTLKGSRLLGIEALPKERILKLRFSGAQDLSPPQDWDPKEVWLLLWMIPAHPEAMIVLPIKSSQVKSDLSAAPSLSGQEVEIISRSRKKSGTGLGRMILPSGANAPTELEPHADWVSSSGAIQKLFQHCLERDIFSGRVQEARERLQDLLLFHKTRGRKAAVARKEAASEPDWQLYGDYLKAHLYMLLQNPPVGQKSIQLEDQVLPLDTKLTLPQQLSHYYHLAKRKARRLQEAEARIQNHQEMGHRISGLLQTLPEILSDLKKGEWDFARLQVLEREAGLPPPDRNPSSGDAKNAAAQKKARASASKWTGRSFTSKEGLVIWVGREKEENLELTFKHARGNDVWLHVKGKPGAHAVIPLSSGRSASLETLLDAATLCIFYSGGEKWGKTEVDYTFKKYVKRIRDSSEASYTHNKTLVVAPDSARLKRLLGDLNLTHSLKEKEN